MKIRLGFVSNSSSASYVVTLFKKFDTVEDLLVDIYDTCWCAIHEKEEEYFYNQELMDIRYPKDPHATTIEKSFFDTLPTLPDRVRRFTDDDGHTNYIEAKVDKVTAMTYMLEQEGIRITPGGNGKFKLVYYTSMHNSFNDMNSLIKNIYFEYLLNQGGADVSWESDS